MYNYQTQVKNLFTPDGLKLYTAVRDRVKRLVEQTGAITMGRATSLPDDIGAAEVWDMMACIDKMVEDGELEEVFRGQNCWAQHRVFTLPINN